MSLSLRQAAQRMSLPPALPSHSQTGKSRLFRVKYFSLISRRLSDQVLNHINRGPSWLAAPYPPGLLHARHEKLRLINHVQVNTFRSGDETEQDHLNRERERKELAMIRIPVLERNNPKNEKIPTMIITSKKKVHKLSVVRHEVARKVWAAFDRATQELEGSSSQLPRASDNLFILAATKEAHDATLQDVTREAVNILRRAVEKNRKRDDGYQKEGKAALFKQRKYHR